MMEVKDMEKDIKHRNGNLDLLRKCQNPSITIPREDKSQVEKYVPIKESDNSLGIRNRSK